MGKKYEPITWNSVNDCLPEREENFYAFSRSKDVLIYGKACGMNMGYLQTWEDNEFPAQWKIKGRDEYNIEEVTHWRHLPVIPD